MGDLVKYADALGLRFGVILTKKDATIVDRVKHHAFCIKHPTDELARVTASDEVVAKGVASFFGEATVNFIRMIQASAK